MANKTLREALMPHNAEGWPELVKQLALLGTLVARAELGQGTLTLAGIKSEPSQPSAASCGTAAVECRCFGDVSDSDSVGVL